MVKVPQSMNGSNYARNNPE